LVAWPSQTSFSPSHPYTTVALPTSIWKKGIIGKRKACESTRNSIVTVATGWIKIPLSFTRGVGVGSSGLWKPETKDFFKASTMTDLVQIYCMIQNKETCKYPI